MDPVRTVRIFLSSPVDVAAEREQARELLLGLARGPFVRGRVLIDVVSWDDPHGGATMDARFTPQEAVNRGLPTPSQCDLTVVFLWGRMGTPLMADGKRYLSGTHWEFENALKANKPVLVYRRSDKVLLDPDDPEFKAKLTQKRRVDGFFKGLEREDGTLLRAFSAYASTDDLVRRLRGDLERHLSELLREDDGGDPTVRERNRGARSAIATGSPEVPVSYRDWVKNQHGGVDLLGLQMKRGRAPSLSTIYVPQTTTPAGGGDLKAGENWMEYLLRPSTLALSRLSAESLYVSGAPGTGKSIFCRWVAWLVAEGATPSLDVPPPDEFTEVLDNGLRGRLPLLLRLREFWEYLPPRVGARLTVSDLEDAIATWVGKSRPDGLDAALIRAHLARGSALLILDGVDEVPVATKSAVVEWLPRQQLLSALTDACPTWIRAGNRLLLTSRPYGLSAEQAAGASLGLAPLEPLPDELRKLLAHRWFAALSADAQTGAEIAEDLFANIHSQPWLMGLASNPLMLTAMCIVFDEGKRLPQDKHELYERVIATVLFSRYQIPAEIERVKRELGVIAFGMHSGAEVHEGRTTPKADATFHEIERWLQAYQDRKRYTERWETDVIDTREALLSRSGLLITSGDQRAGFAHLSFQEFFAAQRTFTVQEQRLAEVFIRRAPTPEWRSTLSFLFGRLLSASTEPEKALDLLRTLIEGAKADDTGLLFVLGDAAEVLSGRGISLPAEQLGGLKDLLLSLLTSARQFAVGAEAGFLLGRLGDPRFREDRLWLPDEDLLGFIPVEPGAFLMGSDPSVDPQARANEQPQHSVQLPEYYIARYPVTVAQFQAFVHDSAFPVRDPESVRGIPNHLVVQVTFAEALAYCEWLTDALRNAEWTPSLLCEHLADGWLITLPTEAEWEKVARGTTGTICAWPNEIKVPNVRSPRVAMGSPRISDTSGDKSADGVSMGDLLSVEQRPRVVGLHFKSTSPFGAFDMGSFGEWTRSPAAKYPYDPTADKPRGSRSSDAALRIVRGFSRPARRVYTHPNGTIRLIGFRLAFTKPPGRP